MSLIVISVSEENRAEIVESYNEFIANPANEFADECVKVLIEKYNANKAEIKRDIFYHPAISWIANEKPIPMAFKFVSSALKTYKLSALGLSRNATLENFRVGRITEGIAMEVLEMDRLSVRDLMAYKFGENWRDDE